MSTEQIKSAVQFIRQKVSMIPEAGIILGTGLGGLVKEMDVLHVLNYTEIPDMPLSTVEGHSGKLIFGNLSGKNIVVMQGRFHFYEGYSMQQVVFPVRVMKYLGINCLFVSNASGGVNPEFEVGNIMLITDHIHLMPNPLIGKNENELGVRFPDMSEPYDKKLIAKARKIAMEKNIKIREGVYAGLTGPTLETPAEYKYIRIIGADTVGMSTTPEVIAARHMELPVFAMSIITDLGVEGKIVKTTHEDVQRAAEKAEPEMTVIMKEMLKQI